jgi:hypothetical protein
MLIHLLSVIGDVFRSDINLLCVIIVVSHIPAPWISSPSRSPAKSKPDLRRRIELLDPSRENQWAFLLHAGSGEIMV